MNEAHDSDMSPVNNSDSDAGTEDTTGPLGTQPGTNA